MIGLYVLIACGLIGVILHGVAIVTENIKIKVMSNVVLYAAPVVTMVTTILQ